MSDKQIDLERGKDWRYVKAPKDKDQPFFQPGGLWFLFCFIGSAALLIFLTGMGWSPKQLLAAAFSITAQ